MKKSMKKIYVISTREFESVKDAENKVNGRFQSGDKQLNQSTRLYRVVEKYSLRLKFVKQKGEI